MKPSNCKTNPACSPFVRGFPGRAGPAGPVGPPTITPGTPGRSITNTDINENGDLIITYSDNTTQNAGNILGPHGPWPGPGPDPEPDPDPELGYTPYITIGIAGDAGLPGLTQTDLFNRLNSLDLQKIILLGDNSYSGEAGFNTDWAAWNPLVISEKIIPVLGNHDVDGVSRYGLHTAKFTYLPGNRRYYNIPLGNGLVEVFVLNDGINTAFESPVTSGAEPDDNIVGSAQHSWFVSALNASTAKWKIVCFHHPLVTSSSLPGDRVATAMDWPEFSRVDGIFCGHVHMSEWLTIRGTPLINVSGAVKTDGNTSLAIQGVGGSSASLIWVDDQRRLFVRLGISPKKITVDYINTANGKVVYSRDLADTSRELSQWGGEVIPPETVPSAETYFLGQSPIGMLVTEWFFGVSISGAPDLTGSLLVNGVSVGNWSIPAGDFYATLTPTDNRLFQGGQVEVVVDSVVGYETWQGLATFARGHIVK